LLEHEQLRSADLEARLGFTRRHAQRTQNTTKAVEYFREIRSR
jgi:hypothetical protein